MDASGTIIRIGNSNGVIIPARMLKALSFAEKDRIIISERDGGLLIMKNESQAQETVFSALDKWAEDQGYDSDVRSALEYANDIRVSRRNKDIKEW